MTSSRSLVDVVIPVYGDHRLTKACLASVLAAGGFCEVVVVDDATPEPELAHHLDDLAAQGSITLLRNASNQGFVRSVNRAMALHDNRDVVVLNADTLVHGDWISRLQHAAHSQEQVATVTPFSNNAEIASHPIPCQANDMDSAALPWVDEAFAAANAKVTIQLPTAMGFCMYIRRAAWQQAGPLDEAAFGRGYGEENDFCLRASAYGWRHLLACDVFVLHHGKASFGRESSHRRHAAMAVLRRRYPHYEPALHAFVAADPAARYRLQADFWRLSHSPRPRVLFLAHDRGGGTWRHMWDLAMLLGDRLEVLVLHPGSGGQVCLMWLRGGEHLKVALRWPQERCLLLALLRQLGVGRMHIHHLVDLPAGLDQLASWLNIPYDLTVHDYYAICPRITLTGIEDRYCGEPDSIGCNRCIRRWPQATRSSIEAWRSRQHAILAGAQRILVPSWDTIRRLRHYFPGLRYTYAPHPEPMGTLPAPSAIEPRSAAATRLEVVIVGVLSRLKGASLVNEVAELAVSQGLPLTCHVLGPVAQGFSRLARRAMVLHGPYEEAALPGLLRDVGAHLAWFPTRWPETYSYTLSACLRSGLPVVAPDCGAFAERLAGRPGLLVPVDAPAAQWLHALFVGAQAAIAPRADLVGHGDAAGTGCDYAAWYAAPIADILTHKPDWPRLQALVSGLHPPRRGWHGARLVMVLAWLRSRPQLAWVASRIPGSWQTMVKRFLLGQVNNV